MKKVNKLKIGILLVATMLFCVGCSSTQSETEQDADLLFYEGAIIDPVYNGSGDEIIGDYSYVFMESEEVTEEVLNQWITEYLMVNEFNYAFILYSDKEGYGVFANSFMLEKDVPIEYYEDGEYTANHKAHYSKSSPSEETISYAIRSDGTLTEW